MDLFDRSLQTKVPIPGGIIGCLALIPYTTSNYQ
jgi:hypothetical protein